jgi:hypothetical protein
MKTAEILQWAQPFEGWCNADERYDATVSPEREATCLGVPIRQPQLQPQGRQ